MGKLERGQQLHCLFKERRTPISLQEICTLFECSESTAKRSIRDLKHLGAPIYCKDSVGYAYDKNRAFELFGIWFSADELHALLTIDALIDKLSGGFFDEKVKIIHDKVNSLLHSSVSSFEEMHRIHILATGSRHHTPSIFAILAHAVLNRQCLQLCYHGRQRNSQTIRKISPQRLVYYKGNWYLDAWCHQTDGLRSFAIEKVLKAELLEEKCKDISDKVLDKTFTRSFGIFSGEPTAIAVLHFTEKAARWVQDEEWFPDLNGHYLENGKFELRIPYNNPIELMMEIGRYGADVEVIEPPELRQQVINKLEYAIAQYS